MRLPRLKVPSDRPSGFYHCISRAVDRRPIFGPDERRHFLLLLREYAHFCRVRVLTHCIMDNHFHLLLEVPRKPSCLPGPDEIVRDLRLLSAATFPGLVAQRFARLQADPDPAAFRDYLATFHARMYDLSNFMKLLKQRFSQWYNRRHGREGALWSQRFRSVVVDGAGEALLTMAGYIDLNPVRAGLVEDPKDYAWNGYGEAVAGGPEAQAGIERLVQALLRGQEEKGVRALEVYRTHLYLEGDERREDTDEQGRPVRGALRAEAVAGVLAAKGRLPAWEYLQCRVRYFSDGAVFGGREFVEDIFRVYRRWFGPRRSTGARRMRGLLRPPFYTLRDFRKRLFGAVARESAGRPADEGRGVG